MVKRILDKDVSSGSSPLGIISCFYSVCKAKQSKAKHHIEVGRVSIELKEIGSRG